MKVMEHVTPDELAADIHQYMDRVLAGETIEISVDGMAVAQLALRPGVTPRDVLAALGVITKADNPHGTAMLEPPVLRPTRMSTAEAMELTREDRW
ncbi:hypothetical protein D5S17_07245 [Pseudonocardiaceae bacterium YIM PH 21723]|nr:hypothetical protein D5S17_07245 [Pseudonocardiaceae bacterium YIM PH 21723]